MTKIFTIPVHEVVARTYPRPPPEEKDEIAMAVGKAIDGTLSQFGYQVGIGRKPTATALRGWAETLLDDGLAEAAVEISPTEREKILRQVHEVVRAYRGSPIFGLTRPKTRVILIDDRVGVYAQPDYWDGRQRIFEMKSYRAVPLPPDVALQLRMFQLAFPRFESVVVCLNRHTTPVETTSAVIPPPSPEEANASLRLAYDVGLRFGEEKVFEYMEGPFVRYTLPPGPVP